MGIIDDIKENAEEIVEEDKERGGFARAEQINQSGKRVIDEEAGVVIYASAGGTGGYAMTALPIEETDLTLDNKPERDD